MLREAAEGGGGGDGVRRRRAVAGARRFAALGELAATMRGGGDAAAEKARALASLAALEAELPGSLLFEWVGALTLRRVGELPAAARRLEAVLERSEALLPGAALPRSLQRRAAPLRHAAVRRRRRRPRPARRRGVAVPAKAMCLWHRAAALSQLGRYDEARDDLRAIAVTAKATGGRLDAQLAQRAAGWLPPRRRRPRARRAQVSYQMGYHRQRRAAGRRRREWRRRGRRRDWRRRRRERDARRTRGARRAVARRRRRVGERRGARGGAAARRRARRRRGRRRPRRARASGAREAAATAEYLETAPDRWVAAFASLELANVCVDTADFEGASAALRAASQVADKSFSFHSWLGSAVREARARLKRARESAGAAPIAEADEVEEAAAGEAPEVAAQRAAMEEEEEAKAAGA